MRIKLRHRIRFAFPDPVRSPMHLLRLTPRSYEGQRINNWRIELVPDCMLRSGEDHFGNITHMLSLAGVVSEIEIRVQGEISNYDAVGIVRGTAERLPPEIYLRETPLTTCSADIRDFAETAAGETDDLIGKLHCTMAAINKHLVVEEPPTKLVGSLAAFEAGRGSAEDHAHLFIACARHLGWPTRCVTGYFVPDEGVARRHAWAEVQVNGLGWIGFDAVHDVCPEETHIRTAVGLDAIDASAIRGLRLDGMTEQVDVTWLLRREGDQRDTARQSQSSEL